MDHGGNHNERLVHQTETQYAPEHNAGYPHLEAPVQNHPVVSYGNPYQQNPYQQNQYQQPPHPQPHHQPQYPPQHPPQYPPQQPPMYQQPPTMIIQTMPGQAEKPAGPTECRGNYPEQFYCITCKKNHVSRVETSWGIGACCWFLFCAPTLVLALLPCCVDGLRDVKHTCPMCRRTVGNNPCCC